ncbi:DUF2235 domain-containing protein [Marinobacter sp. ST-43]|uniref:T6SS phospholipase effector Tle1-like catalytic domain-containing protein n=1 Tax=Marinobacter sp. ST-43 TaxID=3050453 RepID=UPI0026DEE328|nr:DUF2235 domain-containing protein [Marinobacter sp. ST-43]
MFLKYHYDLQPQELLRLESPFFAAEKVRELFRRGTPIPASLFFHYSPPFTHSRSDLHYQELVSKVEAGELCLVYSDIENGSVSAPVVAWRPDNEAESGLWNCVGTFGRGIPGLEELVAEMNRRRITPQTLQKMSATGASSLNEIEQWNQFAESNGGDQPRQGERRLSLPIGGSANIAPLPMSEQHNSTHQERGVHLVMGLFTDGTLNNIDNIEHFREQVRQCEVLEQSDPEAAKACADRIALELGDSYANAPTNVVKLFDLYDESPSSSHTYRMKVYMPGVGTKTGEADSTVGMATGLGETGIAQQVENLFDEAAARIREDLQGREVTTVTFDLFGFSRGAAATRHAVNELSKGKEGQLAKIMHDMGMKWPNQTKIRFVGVFDTVAAIVNPFDLDFSPSNSLNKPIELGLQGGCVDQVIHLVAADEKRANFALNSIKSSNGEMPVNFREIVFPGVHSDIGGGYPDEMEEELRISRKVVLQGSDTDWPEQTMAMDNLESLKAQILSEGWIGPHSLPRENGEKPLLFIEQNKDIHPPPYGRVEMQLRIQRRVKGEYSRCCLRIMYELAFRAGVPLKSIPDQEGYQIPDDLESIYDRLLGHVVEGIDAPKLDSHDSSFLRQRYLHHSDHYNLIEFLMDERKVSMEFPFQELHPMRPTQSRKRIIHFNKDGTQRSC